MNNLQKGALPTVTKNIDKSTDRNARIDLFNHYINHKLNSKKTVLENIINTFNREYRPEKYLVKDVQGNKTFDDSLQDIRSLAHLIVWEATSKYLWGYNDKNKIEYKESFDFCIFASEQVKYKLRTHLRQLNTNRVCGKLPDSDSIRNIYSKLPKLKYEKKSLNNDDYKLIAKENNHNLDDVKLVDQFITAKTESGDESIKNQDQDKNSNKWEQFETKETESFKSDEDIEVLVEKKIISERFNKIKNKFLLSIPKRERDILNNTKFRDFSLSKELSLTALGKKYSISSERVRQISEKYFDLFKKILIKNKKDLVLK